MGWAFRFSSSAPLGNNMAITMYTNNQCAFVTVQAGSVQKCKIANLIWNKKKYRKK